MIEREAVRICLKYFRQKNYMSVFEDLQKKSKVKLEHPQLTEIYDSIFSKGDFLETEALVKSSVEGRATMVFVHFYFKRTTNNSGTVSDPGGGFFVCNYTNLQLVVANFNADLNHYYFCLQSFD